MKRFFAVAALCLLLAACADAEPERPGFLRARASLEVPVGATRAGAAVEVVLDDIPPGYQIERIVLVDPGGGRHRAERLVAARRQSGAAMPGALIGIDVTGGSSSGIKPAFIPRSVGASRAPIWTSPASGAAWSCRSSKHGGRNAGTVSYFRSIQRHGFMRFKAYYPQSNSILSGYLFE